ncbi:hypothetical protein [Desulfobacter postgatei]|uniref:hypothetical protein n=1 Tax=Desulfobacter postgatei TaxID=2293 RepID=UPI002A369185|nr:hypothetical protein [Desulfobacter postgatei]MDX9963627.1 hypothetical protein [Desulfobacter postgatei]
MGSEPNWDDYFSGLSFSEYKNKSPFLSQGAYPTVYNEDNTWIYLGSLDLGVKTDNRKRLEEFFEEIKIVYLSCDEDVSEYKKAQFKADMDELEELIYKIDNP